MRRIGGRSRNWLAQHAACHMLDATSLAVEAHRNSLPEILASSIFPATIQKRKNIHLTRPHTRLAHIQSETDANMCEAVRELAKYVQRNCAID